MYETVTIRRDSFEVGSDMLLVSHYFIHYMIIELNTRHSLVNPTTLGFTYHVHFLIRSIKLDQKQSCTCDKCLVLSLTLT